MKKLVIFSSESVLSGCINCGISEVVDSLANSLVDNYDVCVVCPDNNGLLLNVASTTYQHAESVRYARILRVHYYLIGHNAWPSAAIRTINELAPDIFHNFTKPDYISQLSARPNKCILTFDDHDTVAECAGLFSLYDAVTTVSETYAAEVACTYTTRSMTRSVLNVRGITNGILTPVFAPEKGLLLPARYSASNLSGKSICRTRLRQIYGLDNDVCVYTMMCRLVDAKGIDDVLAATEQIKASGGVLLIVGRGQKKYEDRLSAMSKSDGVIWVRQWASPMQVAPLLAGSDFYLSPSMHEPCGLMPMTACRYGAIPIVTQVGGLADNFDSDNAILVGDQGLGVALSQAAELFNDKLALTQKRKACMSCDFSWDTRKQGYIEVYEA